MEVIYLNIILYFTLFQHFNIMNEGNHIDHLTFNNTIKINIMRTYKLPILT